VQQKRNATPEKILCLCRNCESWLFGPAEVMADLKRDSEGLE
jgi:hypothetical protein